MEGERGVEGGRSLAPFAQAQIIAKDGAIVGVSAVLDNLMCSLLRVFCTEVGDALIGDENVDRVLAVVGM